VSDGPLGRHRIVRPDDGAPAHRPRGGDAVEPAGSDRRQGPWRYGAPVAHTQITRLPDLGSSDRSELDRLLDQSLVGHFAMTGAEGPVVIPTAIARDGDSVLAHGSTGSRWMRRLATGAPTCLAVTHWEGLVVARSAFESSMLYRSAVLFGRCDAVVEPGAKRAALDLLTETFLPGRASEIREPSAKELAATLVLRLPIDEWSLKVSTGWPEDAPEDVSGSAWAGIVPLHASYGEPVAAPDLRTGIDVPPSVNALRTAR
jgi:nitroimidazol reductase NimA-like FMN-containing flavoprotein (pyridoxamine 5'-phosphate oxidase superfamily)